MTGGYSEEFGELTKRAERLLQHPDVDLPHHRELLRLWRYPSFAEYESWLVYTPVARYANVDTPCVVKVIWDRPFDYARFHDPMKGLVHGLALEPAIKLRRAEVSEPELQSRLAALESITLPLLMDKSITLDGEQFGLESSGQPAMRITWRSAVPEPWRPLAEWATGMRRFLDSL